VYDACIYEAEGIADRLQLRASRCVPGAHAELDDGGVANAVTGVERGHDERSPAADGHER
jgi:hypothetical protein